MKAVRTLFVFVIMMTLITSAKATLSDATALLLGDTDGDGEVCITDATKIQRDVAKITEIDNDCQYVSDCEKLFEGQIISMYDTEILDEELTIEEAEMTDGTSVEDTVINNMDIEALHTAIQSLTKEEFAILNMLYFSERKLSETAIAELLGVSVSAVSQRKKSIIKKLKKFFKN